MAKKTTKKKKTAKKRKRAVYDVDLESECTVEDFIAALSKLPQEAVMCVRDGRVHDYQIVLRVNHLDVTIESGSD